MDVDAKELSDILGKEVTSLRGINRLPVHVKEGIYASLIPSDLFATYGLDPVTFFDREGDKTLFLDSPQDKGEVKILLKRSLREIDPLLFVQLSDTSYGQVDFEWIIINDPDSERFQIHNLDSTQFLPPGSEFRNIPEEVRAMKAGLAPGQVRRGLHKFHEVMDLLEALLSRLEIHLIHGAPYAYHNAIELERIGYFYRSGKEMMLEIDREFRPGGRLFRKLDGSTSFRQSGIEKTIRGRSWAIHDGIMDRPWICPMMVKIIGRRAKDYTFPDAIYIPGHPSGVRMSQAGSGDATLRPSERITGPCHLPPRRHLDFDFVPMRT
jgi:hypothetical protein